MFKQIARSLLICLFVFFSFTTSVNAVTANYSVSPVKSDRQNNLDVSYFDLKLTPGELTNLTVVVVNNSSESIKIQTFVDYASTNSNGVVEYKNSQNFQSAQLAYRMQDLIIPDDDVIQLEPQEQKTVTYEVKAPPQVFQGVIVGGINFVEVETEKADTSQGMSIKNQLGYSIAVLMHGEMNVDKANIEIDSLKHNQVNGITSLVIPIVNKSPIFLNQLSIDVTVKRGNKVVYTANKNKAQQAPNSVYNYPIEIEDQDLTPGKYVAEINLSSKGQEWQFERELMIDIKTAKDLNDSRLRIDNKMKYTRYIVVMFLAVSVMITSGIILRKKI